MDVTKIITEPFIYVTDYDYRLVYLNDIARRVLPDIQAGDSSTLIFDRLNVPYDSGRPLKKHIPRENCFSKYFNQWFILRYYPIEWPDEGDCCLITVVPSSIAKPAFASVHATALRQDSIRQLQRDEAFLQDISLYIQQHDPSFFCMVAIDIEHFKLFNKWYGRDRGDRLLSEIGSFLIQIQNDYDAIACYCGSDRFCILLPNDKELVEKIQTGVTNLLLHYTDSSGFLPAFGVYIISSTTESFTEIYDHAKIALSLIKGNYNTRVKWYENSLTERIEDELRLLSDVEIGLQRGEFTFYIQPKCNMSSGKVVGGEALTRWIHATRGFISPGYFIPILERNGFITKLDKYIWESVCKKQREWLDRGFEPLPLSVNVSRIDICTIDVAAYFCELLQKYRLDCKYIEVEITESAYAEDFELIHKTVLSLAKYGFRVLMDDFGSGYSSLNMLNNVSIDVLKLDMRFLDFKERDAKKGYGILEMIIELARLMQLPIIVEGVETKEQTESLLKMGCSYAQGYYFYRPLPIEEFEKILTQKGQLDYEGIFHSV